MAKVIDMAGAVAKLSDGMSLMIGGFMGCGNAHHLVQAIIDAGLTDLTMISNDAAMPGYGVAKLVEHRRLKRLITSHVGLNPEVGAQMNAGELEVELVPQGTLVERIRSGGAGLGGVLTPTGIGTPVADGKPVITLDGRDYLLEKPLRADVALINGYRIDPDGNVWYKGDARNFNPVMATAADLVIAEADHLVGRGEIPPEDVVTPGVFVDYVVMGGAL
ncbi:MAG: 3-oxoacid CoA-transferase subunit A [Propionicimonas sp.]|uniref:CoA transferase subunit A n=1 Tax=Propionicimonas sp. TaxID=1955623 RepID=UPI002B1ED921|nr:3-oxoacid CoA-transferase subunit A [Propionicimonas sp.]MEA4944013.1 3-oxoacid CoA-transferase subunit A [Propionicimonas sp.]